MKRNLISVIILAFSIINFILLAIIVFTVIPTNKKTDNLITSIASIIDLSVENTGEEEGEVVPIEKLYPYTLTNEQTVNLKSANGEEHMAVFQITVSMNTESKDYKKYDPTTDEGIKSKESIIESTVIDIISSHTAEECQNNKAQVTEECKKAVKEIFKSDVIYDLSFNKFLIS